MSDENERTVSTTRVMLREPVEVNIAINLVAAINMEIDDIRFENGEVTISQGEMTTLLENYLLMRKALEGLADGESYYSERDRDRLTAFAKENIR